MYTMLMFNELFLGDVCHMSSCRTSSVLYALRVNCTTVCSGINSFGHDDGGRLVRYAYSTRNVAWCDTMLPRARAGKR